MEIIIKNNRFVCRIHDTDSFIEMPLKNVRKLWKLMFAEAWRNEDSIESLRRWLPNIHAELGSEVERTACEWAEASRIAEMLRQKAEAYGPGKVGVEARKAARKARGELRQSAAAHKQSKHNYIRAEKLNTVFLELAKT